MLRNSYECLGMKPLIVNHKYLDRSRVGKGFALPPLNWPMRQAQSSVTRSYMRMRIPLFPRNRIDHKHRELLLHAAADMEPHDH
jgi:hypothetical protein